jgi:hypothetical protein
MMCTAKAITNGYFPFGAVMLNQKIAEVFESDTTGQASIGSGYTYSGHPVGAAAAIACVKETLRLKVNENAAVRGTQIFDGVKRLAEKYEIIGDVRGGHGLMTALELTSDRTTKAAPKKDKVNAIYKAIYQNGVMVRVSGPNVILSPPLVISEKETAMIIDAIDVAMAANPL